MRFRTLVARGLRFHWRAHLGVVLGAAVGTAVLVGALAVGDSVRWSLRQMALARIGKTDVALVAPDRFFRDRLADEMSGAPVLLARGVVSRDDNRARINQAQVLGVDDRFWSLSSAGRPPEAGGRSPVGVSEQTARRLGIKVGDGLLIRVGKPSAIPLDAPLSNDEDATLTMRVTVRYIVSDAQFGRFSLQANQSAPANVYVPLDWFQARLGLGSSANVILIGGPDGRSLTAAQADDRLSARWQLADAELEVRSLPAQQAVELRSRRVFLDPSVAQAAADTGRGAVGVLTYFVNELRVGGRATPYSMVTAVGPLAGEAKKGSAKKGSGAFSGRSEKGSDPFFAAGPFSADGLLGLLPQNMADDEIVINSWLAEDLGAKVGDPLDLVYYVMGPMRRLETRSRRFRIASIVALQGAAADPTLMPDFPGLYNVENCRDWEPGVSIDLKKIRDKDADYWKRYRGTPKAFVTLRAGRQMWGNRFGDLTAVRWPGQADAASLAADLRTRLTPASVGLYFQPVRERALAASGQAIDFGQLFLGLSMFLAVAAVVLTGLLFTFGAEERAEETGTLLALGLTPRQVRRLYLAEGGAIALAGGVAGVGTGLAYTYLMLRGLATVWRGAVGSSDLFFHVEPASLAIGAAAGFLVALAAIWLSVRRQGRVPARELLAAGAEAELRMPVPRRARAWLGAGLAIVGGAGAAAVMALAPRGGGEAAAGAFFGAGALLLVAGLGVCHTILAAASRSAARRRLRFAGLGVRNAARRRGRSLATVSLLACGVFLVVAVGANRRGAGEDAEDPSSGTGGFALYGESTLPVFQDLNSAEGRKAFGLPAKKGSDPFNYNVVPLRVHEGDEASCLNLNRPQKPRLAAVRPDLLASRGAFTFAAAAPHPEGESPWMLLARPAEDGAVVAIADQNTITWSLGKEVGDTIPYTDERGRTFRIRLVGAIEGSILQGCLVISEDAFVEKFPSESGYRMFLVDAPRGQSAEVSKVLSEQLSDVGLALAPTTERLAEFNAVENTYLAIFQALGGLGLILGSVGLGVVVLRNVMERRGELALLRAVGFRTSSLYWLVLSEHWMLLVMGLACGVAAAVVAVMPALAGGGKAVPYASLSLLLYGVFLCGLVWTYLATRLALRGPILAALRNE